MKSEKILKCRPESKILHIIKFMFLIVERLFQEGYLEIKIIKYKIYFSEANFKHIFFNNFNYHQSNLPINKNGVRMKIIFFS